MYLYVRTTCCVLQKFVTEYTMHAVSSAATYMYDKKLPIVTRANSTESNSNVAEINVKLH